MTRGFTLLEVIITISLLAVMMVSVSALMGGSLDMKIALSQRAQTAGRMNSALTQISSDLTHAFMLSVNNDKERILEGKPRTIFKLSDFAGRTKLVLTTMKNGAVKKNIGEGELSFVTYELKDSEALPGRKDLYRGSVGVIPDDLNSDIETKLIARSIKMMKLEMWNGDSWRTEWNTEKSEFKQTIPKMVKITLVGYDMEPAEGDEDLAKDSDEFDTLRTTAVYLPYAQRFEELKSRNGSLDF